MSTLTRIKNKFKLSEKWSANIFLVAIFLYLLWTAYVSLLRRSGVEISPSLGIMLIPVFLVDGIKTLLQTLTSKKLIKGDQNLNDVTVVIPTYNGANIITETIHDLLKRFDPDHIIISSNGSTDNTCQIARDLGVRILETPQPIGKVEAINRALYMVNTPYVLIMDDDTLIGNAYIPTGALSETNGAVAFTVLPIKNGFWSEMQRHEYRKSMEVGLRFHNNSATVQNVSGAIGLFRTSELMRQTKIHTGEFSGEDLQRTLLVHLSNRGVVMSDSVVETLAPSDFLTLFKQRVYGWYPGFLANFHLYFRLLFRKNIPFKMRFESFFSTIVLTLLDPIRLLSLPILLFQPVYLVFFYVTYVLLESVPYFAMGRNEPFWVILLYPLYGIFNFLTRILSMSVFFYRRISKIVGRGSKNDDYKFVATHARALGTLLASAVVIGTSFGYGEILSLTSNYESLVELPVSLQKTSFDKSLSVTDTNIVIQNNESFSNDPVVIIAKPGDSVWSISEKVADVYLAVKNTHLNAEERIRFVRNIYFCFDRQKVIIGSSWIITPDLLDQSFSKAKY